MHWVDCAVVIRSKQTPLSKQGLNSCHKTTENSFIFVRINKSSGCHHCVQIGTIRNTYIFCTVYFFLAYHVYEALEYNRAVYKVMSNG